MTDAQLAIILVNIAQRVEDAEILVDTELQQMGFKNEKNRNEALRHIGYVASTLRDQADILRESAGQQ